MELIQKENYNQMTEQEKFKIIYSNQVNQDILKYLTPHFDNLTIEILGDYKGNIIELMKQGLLEGWCWETTNTIILLLENNAYIERGFLNFEKDKNYYHSWITFNYQNIDYIFDPCLKITCKKDIFTKVFKPDIKAKISASQVRKYFMKYINNPNQEKSTEFTIIRGEESIYAPMYRGVVGYKPKIEEGKIKKLVAHFYYS